MKNFIFSGFLIIALCAFLIDARSEPVCQYEPTGEFFKAGQEIIHYKKDTKGCIKRIICKDDYTTEETECSLNLCPADKKLDEKVFPDCCCFR